ncbi:MAG: ABC transporter substrate-binding protein [Chloroflexi bacterium]|nr:ABC transporter substrate-binding protein [Chloroflexota bacterium]
MKAILLKVGILFLLTTFVVSCAPAAQPPTPTAKPVAPSPTAVPTPTPKVLTPVRFRLDWKVGAQHAPYYVAKELGYYRDVGLDVTIDEGSGSADSSKLVGTGKIEFGIVDGAALITARSQEIPVVSVAVIYQKTPISLFWLKGKQNIKQPSDLKGKTIGSNPKSATTIGLEALLTAQKIKKEEVKIIPIGFGVEPLLAGQVETMMGFTNSEPVTIRHKGMDIDELLVADYGVKLYGLTLTTNEQILKDKPDLVKGFVQASLKGWQYAFQNPEKTIDIFLKARPEADRKLEMDTLKATLPIVESEATKKNGLGWQEAGIWKEAQDTLFNLGVIAKKTDVDRMFSNAALK